MTNQFSFAGYKWRGLSTFPEGTSWRHRPQSFVDNTNWEALCQYASELHDGADCTVDPQMAMGCNNLVRILVFEDGSRWIARLRLPSINSDETAEVKSALLQREVDCLRLVKERTSVPVPAVLGHDTSAENAIGAPLMLIECLPGNVAMDMRRMVFHLHTSHPSTRRWRGSRQACPSFSPANRED